MKKAFLMTALCGVISFSAFAETSFLSSFLGDDDKKVEQQETKNQMSADDFINSFDKSEKVEKEVKLLDPPPYFDKNNAKGLQAAIQQYFPNAEKQSSSSRSNPNLKLDKNHYMEIEFSENHLYSIKLSSLPKKENLKKIAPVLCSVIGDYPDCDKAIAKMWSIALSGEKVKMLCGSLAVEMVKMNTGHGRFIVRNQTSKESRLYSKSCY